MRSQQHRSTIVDNTDTAETNLSTSISTAQSTIVDNTDTAETNLSTSISTAQSTIVDNTDTAETNLSTSISTAQSTIVDNTDTAETNLTSAISTARSTIVDNTDTAETNLTSAISTARSTIVDNTDTAETNLTSAISTARSTIVDNTDTAETNLSTSISTAQSTIVDNTDTAETNLTSAISTARSTIVDNTDTAETNITNAITALSTARATEKVTVSEAGSTPSANTDIVDTHTNILTLLDSAVHSNIRSIDLLSGDTLKLTSAQFQRLLDAEGTAATDEGKLFSGKIKLDTTLSGTYSQVYSQITDYRIALEEGFAASEYSATVSGTVTVAEADTLRTAGLTMSNQTYSIKDTLALTKAQADSDTGGVLANAAGVEFMTSAGAAVVISDDSTDEHALLNTVASVAGGPITATVKGTGSSLTDGGLSNLNVSDKITFRIKTSATPSQITTLVHETSGLTGANYPVDFSTHSAVLTGAYTDFINAGAATIKTDFQNVLDHSAAAPITLSSFNVTDSSVQIPDFNKLFELAEGAVTVTIGENGENPVLTTILPTDDDVVTVNFGTAAASTTGLLDAINALAQKSGLYRIQGTLTGMTAANVAALHSSLDSDNSRISFTMASDSSGVLTVEQANGLLAHTDTSNATVDFAGGLSDTLDKFASTTETTSELRAIYAEDNTTAITIDNSGTALSTSNDITALNKIATLFQGTGATGTITATVSAGKSVLVSGDVGSEAATLGTDSTDTINITVSDALTPNEWYEIKSKTGGTVTASGGFSAELSQFASHTALENKWDTAVTANPNTAVTITNSELTSANEITALNLVANDGTHTGAKAKITATVRGTLSRLDVGNLKTDNADPVAFEITDTDLTNADIASATGINALKAKTAGVVTVGRVSATAAQLGSLTTGTTDAVTMTATGTGGSASNIANSLVLATKTNSLSKITIEGIQDTQDNIAGSIASDTTGLAELKTLSSTTSTADAIDALYGRVSGTVSISGGNITVANATNISSFTVGTGSGTPITYSITDVAGDDSGTTGVATSTAAVNRAIANATAVVVSGNLTVDQAKEMLEDANGTALTGNPTKFTFSISDTYTNVTNASSSVDSSGNSDPHAKLRIP